MKLKHSRLVVLTLLGLPMAFASCGGDDEPRTFTGNDAAVGGTGGGGATAGAAGSGGTAGTGGATGGVGGGDAGTPCTGPADCDDEEPCNGTETCTNGFCAPGTTLSDGTACNPGGVAQDGGVDHICSGGSCVGKCDNDEDCDDTNVCNGTEVCNVATSTCVSGTPLDCDDADPCTDNECDAEQGCFNPLIDVDGDGQAAEALGACGTDCDDNDPTVYEGAAELCDGKDNNCNGQVDELAPVWHTDCDKDGFAPAGAPSVTQCDEPTTAPPSCSGGGYTPKAPAAGTTDCWDMDADAHPMTATENNTAWQDHPIPNAPTTVDFDYNCDGDEERRWVGYASASAACSWQCGGGGGGIQICNCTGASGWPGGTPACGATNTYTYCSGTPLNCSRKVEARTQECR